MKNELRQLVEIIEQNNEFLLLSHIDPDGDAIGSLIALLLLLRRKGKKAVAYDRDGVPMIYRFLQSSEEIVSSVPSSGKFDAAIFLECPSLQRAGTECRSLIDKIPVWVNLDHHVDNARFGHFDMVKPELSAVAEIIYELFGEMNEPIDMIVAEAIYTAIMTDTGSFKYSNTSPRAHEISGELIKLGIKPYEIYQKVFENLSAPAALIAARAHSTIEVDDGISCITITRAMLEETGAGPEDTHDIVSLGRAIGSVEVALLFRETEDNIKVSLRSKGRVDVNKIAVGFKGGGHLRAAGCDINGSMEDVKKQVVTAVRDALKQSGNPAEDTHE
jgi:phosphoesterase RecJ-like protein